MNVFHIIVPVFVVEVARRGHLPEKSARFRAVDE
jgi:hypothetical protein